MAGQTTRADLAGPRLRAQARQKRRQLETARVQAGGLAIELQEWVELNPCHPAGELVYKAVASIWDAEVALSKAIGASSEGEA